MKNSVVRGTRQIGGRQRRGRCLDGETEGAICGLPEFSRERIEDLVAAPQSRRRSRGHDHQRRSQDRGINLSIKAKDQAEQHEAMQKLASGRPPPLPERPIWERYSRPS